MSLVRASGLSDGETAGKDQANQTPEHAKSVRLSADRSVAIPRIDPDIVPVRALHVAAAPISVVAGATTLAFGGDRGARPGTDDGADGSAPASTNRTADDRTADTANDRAAKGILRRGLTRGHRRQNRQTGRDSKTYNAKTPKHARPSLWSGSHSAGGGFGPDKLPTPERGDAEPADTILRARPTLAPLRRYPRVWC